MQHYDYLIVGSGLFGATFANLASRDGKRCLVIDRRETLGGNVYCERTAGINVHKYGAHIFHTSDRQVWDFVNSFVEFNRYTNSPVANFEGRLYNLPFNMNTFYEMWGVRTPEEAQSKINEQRQQALERMKADGVTEPRNLEEQARLLIGDDIFERLIKGYTEKQWGRACKDLPAFIIKRLPVRLVFDNNYFNDTYQGIPIGGYNKLIEGLLRVQASPQPSPEGSEEGCIDVLTGIDLPINEPHKSAGTTDSNYRMTTSPSAYALLEQSAKNNRKQPTEAESAFWEMVKANSLGVKFRRQHVIGNSIVDFVCLENRLVVEIDGSYHHSPEREMIDNLRSQYLKDMGFAILRLSNEEVIGSPETVEKKVRMALWLASKAPLRGNSGFAVSKSQSSGAPLREGFGEALIYTGQLDEYFDYCLGRLQWRSVRFETEVLHTPNYQGNAVVNYTSADVPYTRVIEHKHFEMFGQHVYDVPDTVVSREYSAEWKPGMEPYYPVNDQRNNALAQQYRELAAKEKNVIFGGRLAEYKYYDMAPVIRSAMDAYEREKERKQ